MQWLRRTNFEDIYLPEAGVNGADKDSKGLSSAAPHGAKDFAEESDEAQPALHIPLLQLLPHGEILLQEGQRQDASSEKPQCHGRGKRLSRERSRRKQKLRVGVGRQTDRQTD